MGISRKHHASALIRSARPAAIHPDKLFVERLRYQLQERAAMMPRHHFRQPGTEKKSWFWLSTFSVGAAMAVLAVIMVVPSLFPGSPQVRGYIQTGPFISGSEITIQELDKHLQPTGSNYRVTTNSDFGDYTLTQDLDSSYVEVIAQGFYYDEVRGKLSAAPLALHSIADISDNRVVNVNILTTLASPRLRYLVETEERPFDEAKRQAEQEILAIFEIEDLSIVSFEKMNISKAGRNHAALLAISVMLQGQQSVAEVSELLSKMSLAVETEGALQKNNPFISTLETNATSLNSHAIREHLQERFAELGVEGTVPNFEEFLEPFVLNADPFSYRLTLLDNTFGVNPTPGATIKITLFGQGFQKGREEVSLKNLVSAKSVTYVDDHTLIAELPISKLSAGSYTVVVRNTDTSRTGVTDGEPLESTVVDVEHKRLILRGYTPKITKVTPSVSYLEGGTIAITGQHFAYGTFVWINGWQVPPQAIRVANSTLIHVDLSPALIANNALLPRKQDLTITVQTPDFQTAEYTGFQIR